MQDLDACFEPLLAVVRGTAVESMHRGAIAVVGTDGELLGAAGDPSVEVLLRSSAKPFQAAAVIESGAAKQFSLTDEEIAVISGSHAGAPEHIGVVGGLLERAGLAAGSLALRSLEHMCSGKHAGMMLLARHLGVPVEGYHRGEHPVQQEVARYVLSLLEACPQRFRCGGATAAGLFAGIDGCGVPVIRTTLYQAAWLYAALAAGATPALKRVRDAMLAHPVLVAGETRFDTRVMRAAEGRLLAKGGAEGVQGLGLVSSALPLGPSAVSRRQGGGLGCVVKVEDGASRPVPPLVVSFLREWALADVALKLEAHYPFRLLNADGAEVGRMEVVAGRTGFMRRISPQAGERAVGPAGGPSPARAVGAVAASGDRPAGARGATEGRPAGPGPFTKEDRVTVCRGDEKEVLRFLREEWPAVDRENFGRSLEWSADPYALVFRREKKIVAVLKGHFIGGVASVDEFMVGERSRGSGIGSMLIGRFEGEARKRGCSRIVLRAVKDSLAEDFYRGRGYHSECVQRGYEFGYDYVRLTCAVEKALGQAGGSPREREEAG
jgi:L-asparaginase